MCGIFCRLSSTARPVPDTFQDALNARGPDAHQELTIQIAGSDLQLQFVATVLALRGQAIVQQPLLDPESGSVLCWNGEAWKLDDQRVDGNDSEAVFRLLLEEKQTLRAHTSKADVIDNIVEALSRLRGPYAFVFYHAKTRLLFYGRDCLGRRSLVQAHQSDGWVLSSICESRDLSQNWTEVEADGVYVLDLTNTADMQNKASNDSFMLASTQRLPHRYTFPNFNLSLPSIVPSEVPSSAVRELHVLLHRAVTTRVTDIRSRNCLPRPADSSLTHPSEVAVLFSGGLDCSLLARMMHDCLPLSIAIDLLNVAFENPRIHKSETKNAFESSSPYEHCPDRVTGRKSHAELQETCPNRRWNLVEIDVPFSDTLQERNAVMNLMYPHNTEMDLSIAIALYFAARGRGFIITTSGREEYSSSARVLLSGLGADELFGGYQRHGIAFSRHGFSGLLDELQLDIGRLGKRNLGRDDRVMSNWGKEVRFPYLDEDVVSWALSAPVWEKCGFGMNTTAHTSGSELDAEKKVLRLLAQELGLKGIAAEKKRAIQFGTRSAKMESGRTRGTQSLS